MGGFVINIVGGLGAHTPFRFDQVRGKHRCENVPYLRLRFFAPCTYLKRDQCCYLGNTTPICIVRYSRTIPTGFKLSLHWPSE
jgi:hypothetical protein